jgi:hypothetical protein
MMVHWQYLEHAKVFVPEGRKSTGETFSMLPLQEELCFQETVGRHVRLDETGHSVCILFEAISLNKRIFLGTCAQILTPTAQGHSCRLAVALGNEVSFSFAGK